MNGRKIPNPVIAVVADVIGSHYYNHTKINILFQESGAPGEPPEANCVLKCEQWLKQCNTHPHVDAHQVLGRILENFMEVPIDPHGFQSEEHETRRKRVRDILAKHSLSYHEGGIILGAGSGPASRSLHELIRAKDLPGVEQEFQRALAAVEADPPSGVTAASSLLESLFKVYLDDNGVPYPNKETIGELYKAVRNHLGLEPSQVADDDLKRILSGLISIVDGIGALRTHTGSAHGHGRRRYRLEPRHARLAINGAHTVAVFVLETWSRRVNEAG